MSKKIALGLSPSLLCLTMASAFAQTPIATPILTGPDNFRDVAGIALDHGGTGYANKTRNNGEMKTGVIYRTNAFIADPTDSTSLTSGDIQALADLNITRVVDLRTPSEVSAKPEEPNIPSGATYTNIDIMGGRTGTDPLPPLDFSSRAGSVLYMQRINEDFVADAGERERVRDVLLDLAHNPGASVFNCTAGKDRTGFIAATLQLIAGVDPDTVMQDYLATNLYTASRMDVTLAGIRASMGDAFADAYDPLLGVDASYLQAGFDKMADMYGTPATGTAAVPPSAYAGPTLSVDPQAFMAYLTQGLGLTKADIYALRGKMVAYQSLPGEAQMTGNAAGGAAFLRSLQYSPLSSNGYSDYNLFLQSAIDAGTLWGVERRVGGQIHADAQSYMLRNALRVDDAIADHISGLNMKAGQTQIWQTTLGAYGDSEGRAGVESASDSTVGLAVGVTHRPTDRVSLNAGLGYNWGSVTSDDSSAKSDVNTGFLSLGGRFALTGLEQGAYTSAQFSVGRTDYSSKRTLGYGLGTASGSSDGMIYDGKVDVGYIFRNDMVSITPRIGARFSHANLDAFTESGSELSLHVNESNNTNVSLTTGVEIRLTEWKFDDFSVSPVLDLGYEHASKSSVSSNASLYSVKVSQKSAYDSQDIGRARLGVVVKGERVDIEAGVGGAYAGSYSDINGRLSLSYKF